MVFIGDIKASFNNEMPDTITTPNVAKAKATATELNVTEKNIRLEFTSFTKTEFIANIII